MGQIISQFPGGGENVKAEVEEYTNLVDEFEGLLTDFVGLPEGADATAEDILLNKKAYVGQELVTGTFDKEAFAEAQKTGQYIWKKYEIDKQQLAGYVVADTENAYPDGGEQDGYWYERYVSQLEQAGIKASVSTFRLGSNQSASSIEHSLGVIPKAVVVFGDVDYTNNHYVSKYSCVFTDKGVGSASVYETKDASGGSSTSYATNAKTATATTVGLSAQAMFQGGKEYTMIVIA